jgi:hypothetical protein
MADRTGPADVWRRSTFHAVQSRALCIFFDRRIFFRQVIQEDMMKTVYFHLLCGASGDMILSSLLDCGVPAGFISGELSRLGINGLTVGVEKVKRNGISCSHLLISSNDRSHFRHLPDITTLVEKGGYDQKVVENCRTVLLSLATAEAAVHGIPVGQVHFHEVGAVDTIVDVLGTCLCLQYLDAQKVLFSELTVGRGSITGAHGTMPNPAPATAELIKGRLVTGLEIDSEILTPTGAAILTALGEQVSAAPGGTVIATGYGCGDKVFDNSPNILRVTLCEQRSGQPAQFTTDSIVVMESDIDHVSGEIMAFTAEQCLESGALDVSWSPVFMKKGRPGYRICVMCRPGDMEKLAACVMANTRTLGVRFRMTERLIAVREETMAARGDETVGVKKYTIGGRNFMKPEYDEMARIAKKENRPLIDVLEEWQRRNG